jgi:hypothetical protein
MEIKTMHYDLQTAYELLGQQHELESLKNIANGTVYHAQVYLPRKGVDRSTLELTDHHWMTIGPDDRLYYWPPNPITQSEAAARIDKYKRLYATSTELEYRIEAYL